MATNGQHTLTGHRGEVNALAIGGANLFSGGQDCTLRVWAYNAQAGIFMSQSIITAEQNGHKVGKDLA